MSDHTRSPEWLVRQLFEVCINDGRIDLLEDIIAEDFIDARGRRGPASVASFIREIRAAFPDIYYTLEEIIVEGDRLALLWNWKGTHVGPFQGFPATGKQVFVTGLAIFRCRDGRIASYRLLPDRLAFYEQIGALPEGFASGGMSPGQREAAAGANAAKGVFAR